MPRTKDGIDVAVGDHVWDPEAELCTVVDLPDDTLGPFTGICATRALGVAPVPMCYGRERNAINARLLQVGAKIARLVQEQNQLLERDATLVVEESRKSNATP